MMRTGARTVLRSAAKPSLFAQAQAAAGRRCISTQPPHLRSRSWKSSALRWGVAVAGIYYYNTSPVFADHPENNLLNPNVDALEDQSPTLDALTASSRRKAQKDASVLQSAIEKTSADDASPDPSVEADATTSSASLIVDSPAELEEEAAGEGAFNPVTGEINWDCPCLGGMAHGPCGPQFREAFSCFVYSTEEPKGMDCIDKFQAMQNCFREHPDIYQGEIEDEDELDAELAQEKEQLAKEIAERKRAVEEKTKPQTGNRLLEEPAKSDKPKKAKKNKKDSETKTERLRSDTAPQSEMKVASSSEPHPGMSAEHEAINEGAASRIYRTPQTKSVEDASVVEDELIPRASYNATTTRQTAK